MQYVAILNPAARHGKAGQQRPAMEAAFREAGLAVRIVCTEAPGHAATLAQEAAQTADAVVAIGGDGTIHEVSWGLIASGRDVPLGVIPFGTGNDFVRMIRMPRKLPEAACALAGAQPVRVDYGLVRWWEGEVVHERPFVNAIGLGFDAQVAIEGEAFKFLPGTLAYLAAVFRTLWRWSSPAARIAEGTVEAPGAMLYEGPLFLAAAGNGVSAGGGFLLTPNASLTDGLLDICLAEDLPTLRALTLLPRVLKGRHVGAPEVHMHRLPAFHLTLTRPLPLHADGEILTPATSQAEIRLIPAGLSVLMPK